MSFLEVKGLAAGYGARAVLREVSFTAEAGQMVGILGANGSGKTTLLKAVCGILPHKGGCTLDGQRLEGLAPRQLARRCGYIPQRSGITIDLPVLEVVLMGFNPQLGLLEQPAPAMRAAARAALAAVALMGVCGELAFEKLETTGGGNASFRNYLIDAVFNMDGNTLERRADYEIC